MTGHTKTTKQKNRLTPPRSSARWYLAGVLAVSYFGLWLSFVAMRHQSLRSARELTAHPEGPLLFVLRIVIFGLSLWIAGGTSLSVALRVIGWHQSAAKVSRILPASLRSLLVRAVGVGLVGSLMIQAGASAAPGTGSPKTSTTAPEKEKVNVKGGRIQQWPVLERRGQVTDATAPTLRITGSKPNMSSVPARGRVSMPVNTIPPSPVTTSPVTTSPATTSPATTSPATTSPTTTMPQDVTAQSASRPASDGPAPSGTKRQHHVEPGEHFWSIATFELQRTGEQVTDQDIARYWEQLIELNRSRLPDPTNPDLLRIGMLLDLPA